MAGGRSEMTITESISLKAWALDYAEQGFRVFPLAPREKTPLSQHGFHDATQSSDIIADYWEKQSEANIGIATEGLIVIDFDVKNQGLESKTELIKKYGPFPRTRVHRTGGGGEHWIYRAPEGSDIRSGAGKYGFSGVDIRANGGYIVAPPSVHSSGNRYEVMDDYPIVPAPAWLVEMASSKPTARTTIEGSRTGLIPEGQRNATLTSLAGSMRRGGMAPEDIEAGLKLENQARCFPPLSDSEVENIAKSIARYEPANMQGVNNNLTDTGNAELIIALHGDKIRYDHRRSRWLVWNGNIWQPDGTGQIYRFAIESARERYHRASIIQDLAERGNSSKWAIGSENRNRIEAAVSITQNLLPVADSGENWDQDRWLLGCANGVIDLQTGDLKPGKQSDRITMSTGIAFDPNAQCPRWEQFLAEIFNGDKTLIDWMWRFLGYGITGDTREQIIVIGYGTGANGKGKFNHALRQSMGDYAHDAPFSTFEMSRASGIPNDLAALERRRFVTSSETNDGTRLNEARIKAISGEDRISARYLHQEFFAFQPACKICLFVNHKPRVEDDSFGFWRRVRLVPFTRQFTGTNDDKQLGKKLDAEAPGILAWLVRGCLEWQKRGLGDIPKSITAATQEYKTESDPLGLFITEICVETPAAVTKSSELYKEYVKWAASLNLRERERLSLTAFGRRMKDKYEKLVQRDATYYRGIGLKSCGGFDPSVVGLTPETPKNQVNPLYNLSREGNIENPPQPTAPTTELRDIPLEPCSCGADNWHYTNEEQPKVVCGKCGVEAR